MNINEKQMRGFIKDSDWEIIKEALEIALFHTNALATEELHKGNDFKDEKVIVKAEKMQELLERIPVER